MNPLQDPCLDRRLTIESGRGLSRTFKIMAAFVAAFVIVIVCTI